MEPRSPPNAPLQTGTERPTPRTWRELVATVALAAVLPTALYAAGHPSVVVSLLIALGAAGAVGIGARTRE